MTNEPSHSESSVIYTDKELSRIRATVEMIPQEASTILAVGCGDGRITMQLQDRYQVFGIDYASDHVKQLGKNGVRADSANLPFPNRSFDLVLCSEVLEHLRDPVFENTREEIERVSKKYIIITVPFEENLRLRYTHCVRCDTQFHVWGHLRSFSNKNLDKLFTSFRPVKKRYFGKRYPYHNSLIVYLNQKFGNRWTEFNHTISCPNCGNTKFERTQRNPVTICCGAINFLTSTFVPVAQNHWIFKLYQRE